MFLRSLRTTHRISGGRSRTNDSVSDMWRAYDFIFFTASGFDAKDVKNTTVATFGSDYQRQNEKWGHSTTPGRENWEIRRDPKASSTNRIVSGKKQPRGNATTFRRQARASKSNTIRIFDDRNTHSFGLLRPDAFAYCGRLGLRIPAV